MNKINKRYKYAAMGIDIFSNMSEFQFVINGIEWKSVEHYYQAMKFKEKEHQEMIRNADSPYRAAALGNNKKIKIRHDWEDVKLGIMERAIYEKFNQNNDIKEMLCATGDKHLVDHTASGEYWGIGDSGKGENMVGKLLMKVRNKLIHC